MSKWIKKFLEDYRKRRLYHDFEKEWRCPYWDCGMVFTAKDRSVNE